MSRRWSAATAEKSITACVFFFNAAPASHSHSGEFDCDPPPAEIDCAVAVGTLPPSTFYTVMELWLQPVSKGRRVSMTPCGPRPNWLEPTLALNLNAAF